MENESRHILGVFASALTRMSGDVMTMASLAQRNLEHAIQGLLDRDTDRCNEAIADDGEVDAYERRLDRDGVEVILRYGPMARDLRRVLAMMKVSTDLERVSDQAVGIARRARRLNEHPAIKEILLVQPLCEAVSTLLRDSIKAFADGDLQTALGIKPRDREIDAMHRDLIEKLTSAMEENPERLKNYMDLILIIRFLERAGDHAVNIAEDTVYVESSVDIRHMSSAPQP